MSQTIAAIKERARKHALKVQAFKAYGGIHCSRCKKHKGNIDVLTLDHTNPIKQGRMREYSGWHLYKKLKDDAYPSGYAVMCFNCNCGHKKAKEPHCLAQ